MTTDSTAWSQRSHELRDLLARSGLGDRRAFEALYARTRAHLFAVVLHIQHDRAVAEDLLQEIYVSVWKAAASFDAAQSQPLTWLTQIARNRAIDSLRRAATQPRMTSTQQNDDMPPLDDQVPHEGPGPVELLDRASEARQLARCLQQLSPQQRQSVALAFYDGLSHAEVAEQLRQPLGTVKSWVRRALATLRTCLDHSMSAEGAATAGLRAARRLGGG